MHFSYALSLEHVLKDEPNLDSILRCYLREEGLTEDEIKRMLKRSRLAPLLPTLYVGVDVALRENDAMSINDNISIASGNITVGPEDNNYDYTNYSAQTFRARAVWRLDELIFNRNEWIYENQKRDYIRMRADLSAKIIKIYEQRLMSLSQYWMLSRKNPSKSEILYHKYLVLTAELDALTHGQFHKRWWRK